jgi:putative addiction module component (TIGR02574 family)
MPAPSIDFEKYTPEERLEMLERLWDSLSKTPDAVPVTDEQRAELDRRLDDLDANPDDGMSLDELARSIRKPKR